MQTFSFWQNCSESFCKIVIHCVKSVQIWSFSGPYFPIFCLNTGKYGLGKTPHLDTFHVVITLRKSENL